MEEVYFMHRIRHKSDGSWDKGIEVKDQGTEQDRKETALQSYHAYLGAYAYGHDPSTDYAACCITTSSGNRLYWEIWAKTEEVKA